jgi:hypothetical protein
MPAQPGGSGHTSLPFAGTHQPPQDAQAAWQEPELAASLAALQRAQAELAAQREQLETAQTNLQLAQAQLDERCQEVETRAMQIRAAQQQLEQEQAQWAEQRAREEAELAASRRAVEAAQREARLRARLLASDDEQPESPPSNMPQREDEQPPQPQAEDEQVETLSSYEAWKRRLLQQEDGEEQPTACSVQRERSTQTERATESEQSSAAHRPTRHAPEQEDEEEDSLSHHLNLFWQRLSQHATARAPAAEPAQQPAGEPAGKNAPQEEPKRRRPSGQPPAERFTDLSVLREVALHNAREAITAHERRRQRRWQQIKLAVAGVGLGLGGARLLLPQYALGSAGLGLVAMSVGCLALAWWLATAMGLTRGGRGGRCTSLAASTGEEGAQGFAKGTARQDADTGGRCDSPSGTLCVDVPESPLGGEQA